jgi:predicted O-linked N-acetylglucosamine transferase (SPINDLY family)
MLKETKEKLQRQRFATGVFDTKLFTRHFESALQTMYDRYQKGLPPEHFNVPR